MNDAHPGYFLVGVSDHAGLADGRVYALLRLSSYRLDAPDADPTELDLDGTCGHASPVRMTYRVPRPTASTYAYALRAAAPVLPRCGRVGTPAALCRVVHRLLHTHCYNYCSIDPYFSTYFILF